MLLTAILSLFCLVGFAEPIKPGFIEYNITQSDGTVVPVYFHESFVPDNTEAGAPVAQEAVPTAPSQELDAHQDFVISWHSDPTIGRLCTLKSRSCTTTDKSAIWDDCVVLKDGFDATPGYWDVSFFQQRNLYGMLGFYGQCILSLARDDDHINDGAQISTVDVTSWMTNAGRSCSVVYPGNVIRVGAKVSLDCPNTGPDGGLARLKLWIHSPDGEFNSRRAVDVPNLSESTQPLELLTTKWNNTLLPVPKCILGTRACLTTEQSPIWDDCKRLQTALDVTTGFWNVSNWLGQGRYSELIFSYTCSVNVARVDGLNQIAQISSYDVRRRLAESKTYCALKYAPGEPDHVEATFADTCPNIPVAKGPSNGMVAINFWVTHH
ncbi:hypothetical protein PG997_010173 [Apiospora hydei]|uniref:Ecp2 effector protein-like domain-containing protein n=1 Tax=Apiospora hydei TaxID=1337664 RepID=A0ABR1VW79_9PEZI